MLYVRAHIKVFRCIASYGEKFLKSILMYLYSTKCNEINVCHLDIQKHVSYEKWFKYIIYLAYWFIQKFSNTQRNVGEGRFLKLILANLYCTECTKLIRFFRCTIAYFKYRITQKIFDILWNMLGNFWICILNCVSWFVSFILNFTALCDAYTA